MSGALSEAVAIVTGGSRGLGERIAAELAAAGARIAITGRDAETLEVAVDRLREAGAEATGIVADVADPLAGAEVVARVQERFGPVRVLVNNAGVQGPVGTVDAVDWDEWVRTVQIDLFGPVLMTRAVLDGMRERGYGKIINVSGGGATGPRPGYSAYAAAKAALVRLTETFAEELSGTRIDINAIAPGAMNTRMLEETLAAGPERAGERAYADALRQRATGGAGFEAGAALTVFLASPVSDGISGRLLAAQWDDWAALPAHRDALMASDVYTLRRIVPEDRPKLPSAP